MSNTYFLGSVECVSLIDVVLTVDDPKYLIVGIDDAAAVVGFLPHDGRI